MSYQFRLYVTGRTARSLNAISNLQRLCEEVLAGEDCGVEVVDVLDAPERAEEDRILTTPTLVMEGAHPRRLTGDLSDEATVLRALGLTARREHDGNSGPTRERGNG